MTAQDLDWSETIERFLELAQRGGVRASTRLVIDLLDDGAPFETIIVKVLAGSQTLVGERWLANEYSVADEHLATHAAQRALDALSHAFEMPRPSGLVVVACADGEWHALPAQMMAEVLRARGVGVSFLGASTPVEHVVRLLARTSPDAVAVSCSMPFNFDGVMALTRAAHHQGVPVLAGGRGLGSGPRYAIALGADAWAAGVGDSLQVLRAWQEQAPVISVQLDPAPSAGTLLGCTTRIATEAFDLLLVHHPSMRRCDQAQLSRSLNDLVVLTRFVMAAALVDDPAVITDFVAWLSSMRSYRGTSADAVADALIALTSVIARHHRPSGELAAAALDLMAV